MQKYLNVLKSVSLFNRINDNELEPILKCLSAEIKKHKKDSIIFIAGDKISSVGIVLSGQVQVIKEDIMGNRTILTELSSGEIFGEIFACAGIEKSPVTVIAMADCDVMFIDYKKIVTTCSSACAFHTILIENMLKLIASKSIVLNQKIDILSKRSTREKIMSFLLTQMEKSKDNSFTIPFSREELADYLCVDRSALSRELCKMRDEGLLKFNKNEFKLSQ